MSYYLCVCSARTLVLRVGCVRPAPPRDLVLRPGGRSDGERAQQLVARGGHPVSQREVPAASV